MNVRLGILTLIIVATLSACAGAPPAAPATDDVYLGVGRGASLGTAVNTAKMDAVRNAVIDLIGADAERAHAARLDDVLYSTRNPNAFVFNETMETLRRDGSLAAGDLVYEIRIRVNVPAVRRTLDANGIGAGMPAAGASASADTSAGSRAATRPAAEGAADTTIAPADYPAVTDAERRFIGRYVDTMTYMVYFDDRSLGELRDGRVDRFTMQSAVAQANNYLVSQGKLVVDAAQVERLKDDQRLIYEESGQGVTLLQWIARRLNADVYIEIDSQISTRASGQGYNAVASVTLSMYETSTGQILGSIVRRSQETFSRTSEADAVRNALQSTVFQAMPDAVGMSRRQMELALTRGIRYELTVQRPADARTMSRFRTEMLAATRGIDTISSAPEEIRYAVFMIGSSDDLVDLLFRVSGRVPGLESMDLVVSRGRAITFDAGM